MEAVITEWWSWVLTAVGVAGLYVARRGVWWSWLIGLAAQGLWVAYALATGQPGFLLSALAYGTVYAGNALAWRRRDRERDEVSAPAICELCRAVGLEPSGSKVIPLRVGEWKRFVPPGDKGLVIDLPPGGSGDLGLLGQHLTGRRGAAMAADDGAAGKGHHGHDCGCNEPEHSSPPDNE